MEYKESSRWGEHAIRDEKECEDSTVASGCLN